MFKDIPELEKTIEELQYNQDHTLLAKDKELYQNLLLRVFEQVIHDKENIFKIPNMIDKMSLPEYQETIKTTIFNVLFSAQDLAKITETMAPTSTASNPTSLQSSTSSMGSTSAVKKSNVVADESEEMENDSADEIDNNPGIVVSTSKILNNSQKNSNPIRKIPNSSTSNPNRLFVSSSSVASNSNTMPTENKILPREQPKRKLSRSNAIYMHDTSKSSLRTRSSSQTTAPRLLGQSQQMQSSSQIIVSQLQKDNVLGEVQKISEKSALLSREKEYPARTSEEFQSKKSGAHSPISRSRDLHDKENSQSSEDCTNSPRFTLHASREKPSEKNRQQEHKKPMGPRS